MRAIVMIFLTLTLVSCKKDKVIDPTGLYNVTTQEGSHTKIGSLTINPSGSNYLVYFDVSSGWYGTLQTQIVNGNMTIPEQLIINSIYKGSGRITEDGAISMDFTILKFGTTYKVKVQGNRAK